MAVAALLSTTGCASRWPVDVEMSLDKAADNRPQLEKVLRHYQRQGNEQKLAAAEFLIANMPGHCYAELVFHDPDGKEVEYDALDYKNFKEARAALEAIEKERGEVDYKAKRVVKDLETISADLLIENIDLAFTAWHEKPWAQDLSFDAFCEYVLPYRGSNEPLDSFRPACLDRYADLADKLDDPRDARQAARLIQKDVHKWVRFNEIFYLHPTDQSFSEMCERGRGRCEDISNMMSYAMRANAIPSACDYTPFWANRDNNHAWEVILDSEGRGKAGLSNRAAKVYRKTFSIQHDNLAFRKGKDEKIPRWLSGKSYIDVTSQYLDTTDVTVRLQNEKPADARFAYLCVFNGGAWKAIHWGEIAGDQVTFTDMGREIAYLPAYYIDKKLEPAGPAFILTAEGEPRLLVPDADAPLTVELTATTPDTPDADTQVTKPMIVVKPGITYELFVWQDDWQSLGKQTAGDKPVAFENVPGGGLYWLVKEESRKLERIFTFENGKQVWW